MTFFKIFYKKIIFIFFLLAILFLLIFLDISMGHQSYTLKQLIQVILGQNFTSSTEKMRIIIWDYRMPIALMAPLIGMMLSLSGSQMQTILNNSLADPFTLGISSAASFGAALSIVYKLQLIPFFYDVFITVNAFIFSISSVLMIYLFIKWKKSTSKEEIVLFGLALFFVFNALQSMLQYITNENQLQEIIFWTMGSFSTSSFNKIKICLIVLIFSLIFFLYHSSQLTALRFGEIQAKGFGVNVENLRIKVLIITSLLASVAVSFVGIIGFIGIIGPHISRQIVGEDHRFFIPSSTIIGGILLSIASIISKNIVSGVVIPIGIISSLLGIPLFIYLLLKNKRESFL